ncbi:Uncharacterized protein dnl_56340 [Desulfonema limicola]|uniref:Uncharacterized protein n=1 Tax=Desulfonema limicola TaxID=45656 RepID=A0A975BCN7_9BACT|nr:Uncharacterized protein dnl_56340 [Desulfonema limicola]
MKRILITKNFRKILKKYRKHFDEHDILDNIQEFIRMGFRKGETRLTSDVFYFFVDNNRII